MLLSLVSGAGPLVAPKPRVMFKSRLLCSTGIMSSVLFAAVTAAHANDVMVNNVAVADASPSFVLVAPGNFTTMVDINTTNINGGFADGVRVIGFAGDITMNVAAGKSITGTLINGAYLTSTTGNISVTNNGTITSAGQGLTLDARFGGDGGNISVNGSGSVSGGVGAGIWALAD
jgi:hypothetical protein